MKKILLLLFILSSFFANSQTLDPLYVDGRVWVKFKQKPSQLKVVSRQRREVSMESYAFFKPLKKKFGVKQTTAPFLGLKRKSPLDQTFMLSFDDVTKIDELIAQLKKDDLIEYVEKVPILKPTLVPNDPSYSTQWHLDKIAAEAAWSRFSTGGTAVIAIVDDAVDISHPDLAPNLWVNPGEIAGNSIDDDGNGYVDDVNGWDVASNDNDPSPPSSTFRHGTHVAGIASAATNNGTGIAAIGFSCKLMCVKTTNELNLITHGYQGIVYAADNGADVINCSWGGTTPGTTGQNIINYALASGCIVVAASGNDNTNVPFYPASYPGVVSVASTRDNDTKSGFSNYGPTITVSAPGSNIYSTLPGGAYGYLSGTSMASPLVAGLLGLMRSYHPGMPNADLVNCLKSSAVSIDALNTSYSGQLGAGRIDAAAAMTCVEVALTHPPVAEFSVNNASISAGGSVRFMESSTYAPTIWSWQFPGGTPATYSGQTPPSITYSSPGVYDVTLTVSNANGSDEMTKTAYITVSPAQSCVQINYPVPSGWTLTNYFTGATNGSDGWINGQNVYLDKEKAMYFDASAYGATYLTDVLVAFGAAYSATPSKQVPVRIYDGTSGSPGATLGTANLTMEQIMSDVDNQFYSKVSFSNPVVLPVSKKIFVSVVLTNLQWTSDEDSPSIRDTLSIVSNSNGQTVPSAIWEKRSNNSWFQYGSAGSWGLNASLLIHPYLTSTPPVATISASKTTVCAGEIVQLDATGSTYEQGIQWNIPGGSPSSSIEVTPSILFNQPGTYRVELATIGGGCQQAREAYVDITVNSVPELSATISKNPVCAGETAAITVTGAAGYTWAPSNGLNTSTGANVNATPSSTTTYTVTGTQGACSANLPVQIEVRPTTASVSISASATTINAGTIVTFTATAGNGGVHPDFDFRKNGFSMQNSASAVWSSSTLADNDIIQCIMTSDEACVVVPQVSSSEITMDVQSALPVRLVSLTSQAVEEGNRVKWEVASEINSAYYDIERSGDELNFVSIGRVEAGSSQKLYSYLDRFPLSGINYYRLNMVDKDGSSAYSKLVAQIGAMDNVALKIAPNPVVNAAHARLLFGGGESGLITIKVINQLGQEVEVIRTNVGKGQTEVWIPVRSLNGIYHVSCTNSVNEVIGKATMVVLK